MMLPKCPANAPPRPHAITLLSARQPDCHGLRMQPPRQSLSLASLFLIAVKFPRLPEDAITKRGFGSGDCLLFRIRNPRAIRFTPDCPGDCFLSPEISSPRQSSPGITPSTDCPGRHPHRISGNHTSGYRLFLIVGRKSDSRSWQSPSLYSPSLIAAPRRQTAVCNHIRRKSGVLIAQSPILTPLLRAKKGPEITIVFSCT